jgi:hypothetical protein
MHLSWILQPVKKKSSRHSRIFPSHTLDVGANPHLAAALPTPIISTAPSKSVELGRFWLSEQLSRRQTLLCAKKTACIKHTARLPLWLVLGSLGVSTR